MTLIDDARAEKIYASLGSGHRGLGWLGREHRGLPGVPRRRRPPSSERCETTPSASSSAMTSGRPASSTPWRPVPWGPATGCCLIMVTPDAEKTMCTNLGIGALLDG